MNAPKVDALAVLDTQMEFAAASDYNGAAADYRNLVATRNAMAKLIEAARRAERLLRDMAEAGFGDPGQADDLRAALARVGGRP